MSHSHSVTRLRVNKPLRFPLSLTRTARTHDPSMQDSDGGSSETVMDVRDDGDSDAPDAPDGGPSTTASTRTKAKRLRHGFVPSQIEDWKDSVRAQEPVSQWGWWRRPDTRAASPSRSTFTESSAASSVSAIRDYANENRTVGTYLVGGPGPLGDGQPMSRGDAA